MKQIMKSLAVVSLFAVATYAAVAQTPAPATTTTTPAIKTETTTSPAPQPGANSFTEAQAKTRILENGYTDVGELAKDKDGIWRGVAKKNGASHNIAVDYQGNITTSAK